MCAFFVDASSTTRAVTMIRQNVIITASTHSTWPGRSLVRHRAFNCGWNGNRERTVTPTCYDCDAMQFACTTIVCSETQHKNRHTSLNSMVPEKHERIPSAHVLGANNDQINDLAMSSSPHQRRSRKCTLGRVHTVQTHNRNTHNSVHFVWSFN